MSLPLSYLEQEKAVIGYILTNGFTGVENYARTKPEAG
jgi:hypothetical protein